MPTVQSLLEQNYFLFLALEIFLSLFVIQMLMSWTDIQILFLFIYVLGWGYLRLLIFKYAIHLAAINYYKHIMTA